MFPTTKGLLVRRTSITLKSNFRCSKCLEPLKPLPSGFGWCHKTIGTLIFTAGRLYQRVSIDTIDPGLDPDRVDCSQGVPVMVLYEG